MKNGFIEILVVIAVLWGAAIFVVGQKVAVEDGVCDDEKIIVPVILGEDCYPTIMIRECNVSSDSYDINCSFKKDK